MFYHLEPLVSEFAEGRLIGQVGGQLGSLHCHPMAQEGEGKDGGQPHDGLPQLGQAWDPRKSKRGWEEVKTRGKGVKISVKGAEKSVKGGPTQRACKTQHFNARHLAC